MIQYYKILKLNVYFILLCPPQLHVHRIRSQPSVIKVDINYMVESKYSNFKNARYYYIKCYKYYKI
jgi:hypothetical protein